MSRVKISIVNGVEISAVVNETHHVFVPIKPICQALGIDDAAQRQRIKRHHILAPVEVTVTSTGADGKNYEMVCLPLEFVYGWLFTIDANLVAKDRQESVAKYQLECYEALYRHFAGSLARRIEENEAEIKALEAVNQAISREREAKAERRKAEEQLARIRASRLDPTPCLEFDN